MAISSNATNYINVVGVITVDSPLAIAAGEISLPLTSAHILVGNGSNVAADVALSGDIAITNAGVSSIGALKVTTAMIAAQSVNTQTGTSYTNVIGDAGKLITLNNAGAIAFTVDTNANVAYPIGTILDLVQLGAGQVTVAGAGGVTVNGPVGLKISARYGRVKLQKIAADVWNINGDLAA